LGTGQKPPGQKSPRQKPDKKPPNIEIIIQSYYICFYIEGDIKRYLKELIQKIKYFFKAYFSKQCEQITHSLLFRTSKVEKVIIVYQ
jgi:hypothetical protein